MSVEGRLALFDLDNTLFDRARAYRAWASAFAASRGLGDDAVDLLVEVDNDGHAPREVVFAAARAELSLGEGIEELIALYRATYPSHFVPDEAVLTSLAALRRLGWRVLIVTNGPPGQVDKIRSAHLDTVVEGWAISDVVGAAKPDPSIFAAAARLVGEELAGVMVGDTYEADVIGGHGVGLTTIWLARGRAAPVGGVRPDVIVPDLAGAIDHLLALPQR